jgi:hypothetical protein
MEKKIIYVLALTNPATVLAALIGAALLVVAAALTFVYLCFLVYAAVIYGLYEWVCQEFVGVKAKAVLPTVKLLTHEGLPTEVLAVETLPPEVEATRPEVVAVAAQEAVEPEPTPMEKALSDVKAGKSMAQASRDHGVSYSKLRRVVSSTTGKTRRNKKQKGKS